MNHNLMTLLGELARTLAKLKATDMLAWVQAMNNISNCAREIVYNETIYNF